MADAVFVIDVEGRVTMTNTAAAHLTGYAPGELKNAAIAKLLVDESSGLRTLVRRRIEEGHVLRKEASWLVGKTGDRIPVSVTGSPILDGGELRGIVLVARDVRELHQLLHDKEEEIARRRAAEEQLLAAKASIEEQLELARTQLLLAERRATLGTLAGGVGHELRNIAQVQVAAVDELAGALHRGEDVTAAALQLLPDLERVGTHITTHGNRLMQLARPGPDHVEPLDLGSVVRDVVTMLKGAGRIRRIDVQLRFSPEPLRVTVNRTRIEQILVNLIVNAVDAIGDNAVGTIMIELAPTPDGKRAMCKVTDSGSGIPSDQLGLIFEPFFTTKPPESGTGLGLPVAKEIIESYNGRLTVASVVGHGTTFTFDLPR